MPAATNQPFKQPWEVFCSFFSSHYTAHLVMEEANSYKHIINLKSSHFGNVVSTSDLGPWDDSKDASTCVYRGQELFALAFLLHESLAGGPKRETCFEGTFCIGLCKWVHFIVGLNLTERKKKKRVFS